MHMVHVHCVTFYDKQGLMRFAMRIGARRTRGRGHPPRAGPAPAVPSLVAEEPRGERKRQLPLGFVRAATYRTPAAVGRGPPRRVWDTVRTHARGGLAGGLAPGEREVFRVLLQWKLDYLRTTQPHAERASGDHTGDLRIA